VSCNFKPQIDCVKNLSSNFLRKESEHECSDFCQLECDSVIYSITPQYILYNPNSEMLNWWRIKLAREV